MRERKLIDVESVQCGCEITREIVLQENQLLSVFDQFYQDHGGCVPSKYSIKKKKLSCFLTQSKATQKCHYFLKVGWKNRASDL